MEIKDINLEEYEISEQKDKEIIVLKKKKSKFPTWEGLGNISGVFIGARSEFFEASGVPASLQKMRYDKQGEIVQVVCLVDSVTKGGEYTLCGNAIPDSAMEYEGAERVDEGFCGSIRDVTCADCINKITYIRSLK